MVLKRLAPDACEPHLALVSCVTLGVVINLSEPEFQH